MEAALVSAATGALQSIAGKLTTLLGDEYKHFKGVRGEIRPLTRELAAMEAFLLKMSEVEDPDVQERLCRDEVRELSYDIEDNLDEFLLCVDDKSAKPDGFMGKMKYLLDTIKTRHRIAKEIKDLEKQVDEVSKRHANYKTGKAISKAINVAVDPRALASFEDVSKLVGTDGPKDEIIKLLTEEAGSESMQQKPKSVSIVGFGGMGKTTLAYQVYHELKGQFDCHAFLPVSRNPDMMKIMRTILSEVSNKNYADTKAADVSQVIRKISNFLADKRYLIVVDDIWNVEIWNVIMCAFPTTNCGSTIITTTRINDVAQSCRSSTNGHIYNIRPLDVVHSRQLFNTRLFNSEEKCPSHLEEVSGQILEKCAGLPLAIIAISGLLANKKRTRDQWDQVKNSIGRGLERSNSVERMMKILSLSYFDLPSDLKTCLLYLSVFPEDYTIEKEDLIWRWIAEGFIKEKSGYTLHESGEMCFNELINRSLIQPAKIWETDHEVNSCRVHDTVFDFIVSKSTEENFVTILGVPGVNPKPQNKVRRLSLQNHCEIPADLVLTNARSLNVFGHGVKIPSLQEFRHLRVLGFDCRQVEEDHLAGIGNLLHLKYIRLKYAKIRTLPEEIAKLQRLETIEVHGDNTIIEIPAAICRLRRLIRLVVNTDTVFSDEFGGMQALEVLEVINGYAQPIHFFQQLSELSKLCKLSIVFNNYDVGENCEDWDDYIEKIASSVCKLGDANLHSLRIIINEGADYILERSWCRAGLEELVIEVDAVSQVPEWIRSLDNLQKLVLPMRELSSKDVKILGDLPGLCYLCIRWFEDDWPELKADLERAIKAHPNNPKLIWIDED